MTSKKRQALAQASGKPNMDREARRHRNPAKRRKPYLLSSTTIVRLGRLVPRPLDGRHASTADSGNNLSGCDWRGALSHRHTAAQNVKGQVVLAADEGTDLAAHYRYFLGAIQTSNFENKSPVSSRSHRFTNVGLSLSSFICGF